MKHRNIVSACCICLLSVIACKDVILIPVKGTIDGHVSDNNGAPLAGVQVSATFYAPSQAPGQPPLPSTITAVTDNYGYYRLSDLWDDVTVAVNQQGFLPLITRADMNEHNHPVLDLTLDGSPTIGRITLDKTTLSSTLPDTVSVRMEVNDVFNFGSAGFTGNFFLKSASGAIVAIIPATLLSASLEQYLFSAIIVPGDFPAGVYGLQAEIQDPDGNRHQTEAGQSILVE